MIWVKKNLESLYLLTKRLYAIMCDCAYLTLDTLSDHKYS
jgi:hypothetical protein